MSYVTIYKVEANGDVVEVGEGSNNHTFAPLVWDFLGQKHGYMNKKANPFSLVDPGLAIMWKEWPSPKMSRLEQVLLGATFDFVWFKRELLPELIEACEWFLREFVQPKRMERNWKGEMEEQSYDSRTLSGDAEDSLYKRKGIIACLKEIYEDPTARGAAFNCCSAVGSFWIVYDVPTEPEDTDEVEIEFESRPWNVDRDTEQPRGEYPGKSAWELSAVLNSPT